MPKLWAFLFTAALLAAGCASKQQQPAVIIAPAAPMAAVMFTGDVKMQLVQWVEGITLAEALLMAQYTGSWDPHTITVTRNGIRYNINVRKFLRGEDNPELQAGDTVEVRH
jgi:hypothetical protein